MSRHIRRFNADADIDADTNADIDTDTDTEAHIMLKTRLVGGKLLRCGYTTGSCAAAAAKAAAYMLCTGERTDKVSIMTPSGEPLTLDILDISLDEGSATCAVRKDSGDDPDITNGMLVYARVTPTESEVEVDGGEGVGRVTKPGLDQPVGAAAINSTPRRMIVSALEEVIRETEVKGGLRAEIILPQGRALAKKTFNPNLGIVDGLSILGTTGIVEPMSESALIESNRIEISMVAASGAEELLVTLGNYGTDFARDEMGLTIRSHIMCSNFVGEALDAAAELGFKDILLIGHIGKLVKLGIGLFNTHSKHGDGRIETLIACALEAGAELETLRSLDKCVTTDAALDILSESGCAQETMRILSDRVGHYLRKRLPETVNIEYLCFTNAGICKGVLFQSENAAGLAERWR